MPKSLTPRQQRFLFSKGSPLSKRQKSKLAGELRSGKAKVRKKSSRKKRSR